MPSSPSSILVLVIASFIHALARLAVCSSSPSPERSPSSPSPEHQSTRHRPLCQSARHRSHRCALILVVERSPLASTTPRARPLSLEASSTRTRASSWPAPRARHPPRSSSSISSPCALVLVLVLAIVLVLAVLCVSNSVCMSVFRGGPEAPPFCLFCAAVLSSIKIYLMTDCFFSS